MDRVGRKPRATIQNDWEAAIDEVAQSTPHATHTRPERDDMPAASGNTRLGNASTSLPRDSIFGDLDPRNFLANFRAGSPSSGEDEYGLPVNKAPPSVAPRKLTPAGEEPKIRTRCDQCASLLSHGPNVKTLRCGACGKIMDLSPRVEMEPTGLDMNKTKENVQKKDGHLDSGVWFR